MKHSEARLRLADYAVSKPGAVSLERMARHVESCRQCREWVDTYRFLRAGLDDRYNVSQDHPPSETLARWTVTRGDLPRDEQREVAAHLRGCSACRDEARRVGTALKAARPRSPGRSARARPGRGLSSRPGLVVLAATLAAALGLGFLVRTLLMRSETEVPLSSVTREVRGPQLDEDELAGTRVVQGGQSLLLTNLNVRDGAVVTFKAGRRLALGDGFAVGSNTRVVFEVGEAAGRGSRSEQIN